MRGLTVTAPCSEVKLTTLARLKADLGETGTGDDAVMTSALERASATIDKYCHRTFARQGYTELGPAFGGIEFSCAQAPVVALGTVTFDGTALTDVTVADKDQGVLYREKRFAWTAQSFVGLSGGGRLWDVGIPIRGQEEPLWSVSYTAGFIPAGQETSGNKMTVSATGASFNDTGAGFSSLLKSGDIITVSGFTNSANNGRFVVTGTPTTSKIVVTSTGLVNDTSTGAEIDPQTLPGDVEQAVIETAKTFYQQRKTDSTVVEKQMGIARLRFGEQGGGGGIEALPPRAVGLLRPWVRSG